VQVLAAGCPQSVEDFMSKPRAAALEDLRSPRLAMLACGIWWCFFRAGTAIGAGRSLLVAAKATGIPGIALVLCLLLTRLHPLAGGWFLILTGVSIIAASPFLEFRLASVLPFEAIVLALSLPLIFCGFLFVRVIRDTRETSRRDVRPAQTFDEFRFAGRG